MNNYDFYYLAKRNLLKNADQRVVKRGFLDKKSKIHISAVCGKAMASIACILSDLGYSMQASDDNFYPPMSEVLSNKGIICKKPSIENLDNIDLFIPGNMLPPDHLEVIEAKKRNIPMVSGPEVLGQILTLNKRSLVVCGTHGKTTVSSLLTSVFDKTDKKPAFLVGGVIKKLGSYSVGFNSDFAIFEGDEYDCAFFDKAPKFLRYNPTSAIITSIEHDHFDLYPTFEDYKQSFQFLIEKTPKEGFLVCHSSILNILDFSLCKSKIYIYDKKNNERIYKVKLINEKGTYFDFTFENKEYKDFFVPLFGDYNIENTLSTVILSLLEGLDEMIIRKGLEDFSGVAERQEFIGEKDGVKIFRDFAHHPTAVKETLEGFKKRFPENRIITVFHPRSITSRKKVFENDYINSLNNADVSIIINPPFKENDNLNDFMDTSVIKSGLEKGNKKVFIVPDVRSTKSLVNDIVQKGDVVIFMSNSNLENVPEDLVK